MPSNDIKWRVMNLEGEELSLELINDCPLFLKILVKCNWNLEISRISQAVRTNWPQIRNHEMTFEDFT